MATYYALTTYHEGMAGWTILAAGATRAAAQAEAERRLGPIQRTGYTQTEYRNLVVLSQSAALRGHYISRHQIDEYFRTLPLCAGVRD